VHIASGEAGLLQEGLEDIYHLVVAILVPHTPLQTHRRVVHFVDANDELLHAGRLGQDRVLARLAAAVETGLELTLAHRDDEAGHVGLRRTANHVWHEVLVPGRIQDGVVLLVCLEIAAAHSCVLPFARSSSVVSIHQANFHDSLCLALASRSYFSIVRSST